MIALRLLRIGVEFVLIGLAILALLLTTESGTRWLLDRLQQFTPVTIESSSGTLAYRLRLEGLEIAWGPNRVSADHLELELNLIELLAGRVAVVELDAGRLVYGRAPDPAPPAGPTELPRVHLPITLDLRNGDVRRAVIDWQGQRLLLGRVRAVGTWRGERLTAETLWLDRALGKHRLAAQAEGSLRLRDDYPIAITGGWRIGPGTGVSGQADVLGSLRKLEVVHSLNTPVAVHTQGSIRPLVPDGPQLELSGFWRFATLPFDAEAPAVITRSARYRLTGTPTDYRVQVNGDFTAAGFPSGPLRIQGQGDLEGLRIKQADWSVLDGRLIGHGALDWTEAFRWEAQVKGRDLDPAGHWPTPAGQVAIRLSGEGQIDTGGSETRLNLERLQGHLRGQPVTAAGAMHFDPEGVRLQPSQLTLAGNRLSARGVIEPVLAMDWTLEAEHLGGLHPQIEGALNAEGTFAMPKEQPVLEASWTGRSLSLGPIRLDRAEGHIQPAPGPSPSHRLLMTGRDLRSRELNLGHLRLTLAGDANRQDLALRLSGGEAGLELQANNRRSEDGFIGRIQRAALRLPEGLGSWSLRHSVRLNWSPEAVARTRACWQAEPAWLCLDGRWAKATGGQATLRLRNLPLEALLPPLNADAEFVDRLQAQGWLQADARASIGTDPAQWSIQLDWETVDGRITLPDPTTEVIRRVRLETAAGTLAASPDGLETQARLRATPKLAVDLEASTRGLDRDAPLDGRLSYEGSRFDALIPGLSTRVTDLEGTLTGRWRLQGTRQRPELIGSTRLDGLSGTLPQLNVRIRSGELELSGRYAPHTTTALEVTGRIRSGPGAATLRGQLRPTARQDAWLSLQIQGEDLEVINTPDYRILTAPKLDLHVGRERIEITGRVRVPEAQIALRRLPKTGVPLSTDEVIVIDGEPQGNQRLAPPVHARVTWILGERVWFTGFNLTARLDGAVVVTEQPDELTTASGQFRVAEGRYTIFGKRLEVENSRLLFNGPLLNPGLDLQATRAVDDSRVGLRLTGRASSPEIRLFSDEPMDQSEILSYLSVGQPMEGDAAAGQVVAINALTSVGLQQGASLDQRVAESLALDQIGLRIRDQDDPGALVLGKYFSPRLYVSYTVGFAETGSGIRLDYRLSDRFGIEAETRPGRTGLDLIYSFDD